MWSLLLSCFSAHAVIPDPPVGQPVADVAIVPGCPATSQGTLSACGWRRTLWAAHLYERGVVHHLIPSGAAVQNRTVEARLIAAGLVALGVPSQAITLETQALHTDENVAYAALIAHKRGWTRLAVASDRGQARAACVMLRAWYPHPCVPLPVDRAWIRARLKAPLPQVHVAPVPAQAWTPLRERERAIARNRGTHRRPNSVWYYAWMASPFAHKIPPTPPEPVPWPKPCGCSHPPAAQAAFGAALTTPPALPEHRVGGRAKPPP